MSTITSKISHGITIGTDGYNSPLTITAAGYVGNDGGVAIYSDSVATVVNAGTIRGNASSGIGVTLAGGGSVTNEAGGTISGYNGVVAATVATVVNAGSIFVSGLYGVQLVGGGSVTNQSGGTIRGRDGVFAAAVATVVNAGSIGGNLYGVALYASGWVTNQSGGRISGFEGVLTKAVATVVNAGYITGNSGGSGIELGGGGSVTNQSGGRISGFDGVDAAAMATVVNAGVIAAYGVDGIDLSAGGSVTNQVGGTISAGSYGIIAANADTTVVNAGSIGGNIYGIELKGGGSITNQAGGRISGPSGIFARKGAATVVNAGYIGGSYAVKFEAGYTNRLAVDAGAVFSGTVDGGNAIGSSYVSTLELASGSAGTLTGLGSQFVNFGSVAFDQGADWFIEGSTAGLAGSISGFAPGDTIDIGGITVTGSSFADGVLTLDEASGSVSLDLVGDFTTNDFVVTNVNGGAAVTALCFCVNTLIETPAGARPVQDLLAGDLVVTWGGAVRPIAWVGTGSVLATRGRRDTATPVIVRKGALRDNVPNQDLRVTKGHSFLVDNVLIPVEFLVNHRSILWDDRAQEVKLYHIELETHDVLIANGAPAESYRDDGNRWLFQNANIGWDQPAKPPCAPVLTGGPVVDAAWRRLLDRAGPRHLPPLTDEPDLHLLIDGMRVDPQYRHGSVYGFRLPCRPRSAAVASRSGAPSELAIARDPRSLGVALRQVVVQQGAKFMLIDADDERLTAGFHAYEADCNLRWTDGCAELPAAAFARFDQGAEVMLHLGGATQYLDEGQSAARAAA